MATATSAAQAMLEGDPQRSRVFAGQSADAPPQTLLWQAEKLFRLRFSEPFETRVGSAVIHGEWPTGHRFFPPLVSNGTIFFNTYQEDAYFYAIDAATGKQIVTLKFGDNALSVPAALGSVAFFGTYKGRVNAYDASTQELKWYYEEKDISFSNAEPVIVDAVIYLCGYPGGVYAFSADTGALLWRFKIKEPLFGPAVKGEDVIIVGLKSLIALDRKTGARRWESSIGRAFWGPSILDDQILVRHIEGEVRAYALKDGALKWKSKKQGGAVTKLALFNGLVIYGEEYKNLAALDALTGLEKWRFKTKKRCRDPIVTGAIAYARCDDHYLYALDAETGLLKWKMDTRASGMTPIIANGVMYSLSSDGVLQAFR